MTLVESLRENIELDLPDGFRIYPDVMRGLGNIYIPVGQVLVGDLDPEKVNTYSYDSPQARKIASAMCFLQITLPKEHGIEFNSIPGVKSLVGLWVVHEDN